MTIAIIIAVCIILLILAFLLPRLSRHPQRGVDRTLGVGQRTGGKAPGPIGRLFSKSFGMLTATPEGASVRGAGSRLCVT